MMTVIIASLFLPYTINFESGSSQGSSEKATPLESDNDGSEATQKDYIGKHGPAHSQHGRSQSLNFTSEFLRQSASKTIILPKTPGATTDTEKIFLPNISKRPINLSLPARDHISNKSTASLQTLAAFDSQAAGWGRITDLKQPKSRAKSPPPQSILSREDIPPREPDDSMQALKHARFNPTPRRSASKEREMPQDFDSYNIEPNTLGNVGLFSAINAVSSAGALPDKTWVGTLGMPTDALGQTVKDGIKERLEDEHEALPVFVDDSDMNGHYEHYCKTILWPIFHYQVPDRPKSKAYQDRSWKYYLKVNEAFADRIIAHYKKGDVIWVHDYHLLLVPGLIRAKIPEAQIGFFLHSAFPSSEIFRVLPVRERLIEGILGANMIGFQTEEYVHHFLQTCNRIINVEATKHGLVLETGRGVDVFQFPMGIDAPSMNERRDLFEVKDWIKIIGEKYAGKKIVVARDKLDSINGIREKLLAYELFLKEYPEWVDQVVLIQIAAATSTEDRDLSIAISDIITRINSNHSTLAHQPIVFLKQDIDYSQYLALLTVAECLLMTGLREGMNLTSHEFVVCQDGRHSLKQHAPLVLSEFTGAASVLGEGALLVNPWHYRSVSKAINKALSMDSREREHRWELMHKQLLTQDATNWFERYMVALKHAWTEHSVREPSSVPRLSIKDLRASYVNSTRRLILVDYEGTLTSSSAVNERSTPTPKRALDIMNELIDDEKNIVYIMSQRSPEELDDTFRNVPDLGLIAENGAFLRRFGQNKWVDIVDMNHVAQWRDGVTAILKYYEERIEGSVIEQLKSAFLFRYDEADDQESAFRQAGECANQINEVCHGQHVSAVPIDQGFCVSDTNVNKGLTAKHIEEELKTEDKPDFVLVIGDSREDEYVFNWAHSLKEKGVPAITTVSVGQRNTEASATLTQGTTGVLSTLEKLARTI